jgi:predicted transcriptional regulator
VITATTLARILGVSTQAALAALDELRGAGILRTKAIERGASAYLATEVLDLITFTERALASTKFDTRASPPHRNAPVRPRRGW